VQLLNWHNKGPISTFQPHPILISSHPKEVTQFSAMPMKRYGRWLNGNQALAALSLQSHHISPKHCVRSIDTGGGETNPGIWSRVIGDREHLIVFDRFVFNPLKISHNTTWSVPWIEAGYQIVILQRTMWKWVKIRIFPVKHRKLLRKIGKNHALD
jgi:hypothetical protein